MMAPMLLVIFLGGYFLYAGAFVLTLYALKEFSNAFGEKKPAAWVFVTSTILLYGGYLIPNLRAYIVLPWVFISIAL
jgi:hypothetical protein